jgi:SulP family sulfate permease
MAKLRTRLHLLANQARLTRLEFFPLRKALVGYRRAQAVDDFKAALNVALLAFPQAMAYAAIAGLPIQYGVYGSAIAALLGPMLGGSRLLVLGPTNATAVLLFGSFLMLGVEPSQVPWLVPLVCLMTGVFLLIGAFLRVANLIQFVSRSVIAGYITAAAVYIIANQMSKALGITFEVAQGYTLLDIIWRTLVNLPNAHLPTVLLSALTACVYFIQKKAFPRLPNVAITLVLMSLAAWGLNEAMLRVGLMERYGELAHLSGIDAASWSFTAPRLTIERVSLVAQTALLLAFLSILESASVGKSVAARAGLRFDVSQEMLGMAMANIGCAFLNGMPASGSPVRSQLNWNSGAASPLSSIMSGLIVAVAAFTLGPFTRYIPSGALGCW